MITRPRAAILLQTGIAAWFCLTAVVSDAFASNKGAVTKRPTQPIALRILAINDFHGHLQPPPGGLLVIPDSTSKASPKRVPAGGAEHMATLVKQLRSSSKHSVFVAAGDLVGASPFLSAMFNDEPTIESLSLMGLDMAAVGNHEFDAGKDELLRLQHGGCHPSAGCQGPQRFTGASFQYLAASTFEAGASRSILPPFQIRLYDGIPVAFIGLTFKGTPNSVSPKGIEGLEFRDEIETVNTLVPQLRSVGIEAIVVLIHQGGETTGGRNECPAITGPIFDLVKGFDRAVDIVISGHTHRAYTCEIDGRLVTSGDKYGAMVTAIDVELSHVSGDVIAAKANNVIVEPAKYAKDPAQTALIASYNDVAAPIAARKVGAITATLSPQPNQAGESLLGKIVADAHLAATRGAGRGDAVMAFTNPGGVRSPITGTTGTAVTYGEIFAAQPFRNQLVTLTLTGDQILTALEQQWLAPDRPHVLQVSSGFSYTWDAGGQPGSRVLRDSVKLNNEPINPAKDYRVTVNSFLAAGGDSFSIFTKGGMPIVSGYDTDALAAYFKVNSPIAPDETPRINRIN